MDPSNHVLNCKHGHIVATVVAGAQLCLKWQMFCSDGTVAAGPAGPAQLSHLSGCIKGELTAKKIC